MELGEKVFAEVQHKIKGEYKPLYIYGIITEVISKTHKKYFAGDEITTTKTYTVIDSRGESYQRLTDEDFISENDFIARIQAELRGIISSQYLYERTEENGS